jgi:hypothetical protein
VNPDAGREADAAPAPAEPPRRVAVAGGGPAGLECARRLAERGHRVDLHEATDHLGGMLRLAEAADPDLVGLRDWLVAAAEDAGVAIHLGSRVTEAPEADVLVWAVGTPWPDVANLEPWLLDGGDPPLSPVVHGSSKAAVSIAARARAGGADVLLVPDDPVLAPELGLPGRFRLVTDVRAAGVTIAAAADRPGTDVHVARGSPVAPPAHPEVHVIGDAAGTTGIAAALRAAADLARRV